MNLKCSHGASNRATQWRESVVRRILTMLLVVGTAVALVLTGQAASQAKVAPGVHLVKVAGSSAKGWTLTWSEGSVFHRYPLKRELWFECGDSTPHKRACRRGVRAEYRGLARLRDALAAKDREIAAAKAGEAKAKAAEVAAEAALHQVALEQAGYNHADELDWHPLPDPRPDGAPWPVIRNQGCVGGSGAIAPRIIPRYSTSLPVFTCSP